MDTYIHRPMQVILFASFHLNRNFVSKIVNQEANKVCGYLWSYLHTYTHTLGGVLVEMTPFDWRVVGSNPALSAKLRPWASPSLTVACSVSACKLRNSVNCCGRERF